MKKTKFILFKNMVTLFLLALCSTSALAQPDCPGGGWENEPIQDPDGCCIQFDMLPSTLDFPWTYWFVVADGETYDSGDYASGFFDVCYEDAGMYNVVVTYVDAYGVTLCENDWTVFVDEGCGPDIICEDCVDFTGIEVTTMDLCTFDFEMVYTVDPACGGITIDSYSWDYGYFGGFGSGAIDSHTFPGDDSYDVIATIEYTVDATGLTCKHEQIVEVDVTGCSPGGILCGLDPLISISDTEMEIELPTREPCGSPTYIIEIREVGDVDFTLATATVSALPPYTATITGLDPCTPYETKITLQCAGGIDGICFSGETYVTDCPPPCSSGCLITDGIDILFIDGCDYTLEANYETTDACGDIEVTSVVWDWEEGTTATGDIAEISFLCGGMKTVTATINYTTYPDIECKATITREINAFGCDEVCTTCFDDECVRAYELIAEPRGGCLYWFTFDSALGDCGAIDPESISFEWDFGYDGGIIIDEDGVFWIEHSFPEDGPYTITMTYYYTLLGEEEERSCTMTVDIDVKGCHGGKDTPKRGQIIFESGQINASSGIMSTTVPNPADEEVTITVLDPNNISDADQLQLVIFDINGRKVYNGNTTVGSQKMIDISHFESGLYIYEVRDGETVILKEKLLIK
jgi:hypothetical protein